MISRNKCIIFISIYTFILVFTSYYRNELSFTFCGDKETLTCPSTVFNRDRDTYIDNSSVNCAYLFKRKSNVSSRYLWCRDPMTPPRVYDSCTFARRHSYRLPVSDDERRFPLAFRFAMIH